MFFVVRRYILVMAHATKNRSKKKRSQKPQVRTTQQVSPQQQKKAVKKVQKRVRDTNPFQTAWFIIPILVALVCSPALAIFTASIGAILLLVALCLQKNDRMRGPLLAAGVGAIAGSLPWIVYMILKATGVVG